MTPGGHEVDFDRILVEELAKCGHTVEFLVPQGFKFSFDYKVPVHELAGQVVSYSGMTGLKKLLLSVKREVNRLSWYRQIYRLAQAKKYDAIIVPTSTYRYLRALAKSVLKKSPIPIVFILHGINPTEAPKFLRAVQKLEKWPNIRPTVLNFTDNIFGVKRPNIRTIYPPTFIPRDINWQPQSQNLTDKTNLIIGFFGQYRREKHLEDFLDVYLQGNYNRPVQLLVQGATMHPEDSVDFERIIKKYQKHSEIEFLHKGLIGAEWQQAIANIDVLLLPYSAERYRYHWGGMLFTAIGFQKPVIVSDDMNPEVFAKFHIGERFKSGDQTALKTTLENFINHYDDNKTGYKAELAKAAAEYSPAVFARQIESICLAN